jgi:coenzyme F420-reducing hydrogenase gamma subunit
MADPNQTTERGEWLCPCSGCQKSISAERKQLIALIQELKVNAYSELPYDQVIELIQDRMPKPKVRK